MPQGKQPPSPKRRSAEEVIQDECVSAALTLLQLRSRLRKGDSRVIQDVAREGARIAGLANLAGIAVQRRLESRYCEWQLDIRSRGDQ